MDFIADNDKAVRLLYHQDGFPVFQNKMYDTEISAKECPKGDITLVEDLSTGLIYNSSFHHEIMCYDKSYQNEQAVSPFFRCHLEKVAAIIRRCIGKRSLVEIGCGKGFFLELMIENGFDVTGYDPAYEGNNPFIYSRYFNPEVGAPSDGLILRHVLEHIEDPYQFLLLLKNANGGKGKIYIEVPCFDWICTHRVWFDIYYEHVNYFRLSDFTRIFSDIIECGRFFGQGQYLYVVAELASLRKPKIDEANRMTFPDDFCKKIARPEIEKLNKIASWGGASKGVIFSFLRNRFDYPVDMVIDINVAKQGKYLPGTGLKVKSPAEAMMILPEDSIVYVMNSNYIEEIIQMTGGIFNYIGADHD
jgi:SAM-dependent methyltransferase